jgi:hypothetical protein
MKQNGRPSKYTKVLADKICDRIMSGESLLSICKDPSMPSRSNIHKWILKYQYFRDNYACAREVRADILFDEILDIADETSQDTITDEDGYEKPNSEWITRSKLRVDARKWTLSKMQPKKYGDKLEVDQKTEHSGKIEHGVVINIIGE